MTKRALLSVGDPTEIVNFAIELDRRGWELVASHTTWQVLSEGGVDNAIDVVSITGLDADLDTRIEVLHPRIIAAISADRENPAHTGYLERYGIQPFDMVVCNVSPFGLDASDPAYVPPVASQIDFAGHTLLLAAAASWRNVILVTNP